ncbi:MAG: GNAT family N-acetyltransferase, partial [Myxococcales bacterium]|nr:GNAT family N-acetyltransferase [Myxococcales bacterium]
MEPHVIEAKGVEDWQWERELAVRLCGREPLIVEVNGSPVGYVEILDPSRDEERYWGDAPGSLRAIDIWIGEPSFLGRGYGTRVMKIVIDRCFEDASVEAIMIDPLASNVRARRFYERLLGRHHSEKTARHYEYQLLQFGRYLKQRGLSFSEVSQDDLEAFLNVIPFGRGLHGIELAARHYFGKHPSE